MRTFTAFCRYSFILFSCLLVSIILSAQAVSISGDNTDINTNTGSNLVVDNTIVVSSGSNISNASVLIASGYLTGDQLSIDLSGLPGGASSNFDPITGRLTITSNASAAEWQTALRTVTFSTTSLTGGARKIIFTVGDALYNYFNGHYYEFVNASLSWTDSKTDAESRNLFGLGGYLTTITSQEENDFIKSKLNADGWIGASDDYSYINAATGSPTYADQSESEGLWYWVTGPEAGTEFSHDNDSPVTITYAHWAGGEPNNWGGEDYGEIYSGNDGSWNDLNDWNTLGYVVEYGGSVGDPVVSLSSSRDVIVSCPALTGNAATPAHFNNHGLHYIVEPNIQFTNVGSITDVTVNISQNFQFGDAIDFDTDFLPGGVVSSYNSDAGILNFTGTASASDWNALLQTVFFYTNAPNAADRKVTFNAGNIPASPEGHFYVPTNSSMIYYDLPTYLTNTDPSMAKLMGLQGYLINITSDSENVFVQKKMPADFWIPLSDEYAMLNDMLGYINYNDQSESEGNFYWISGPLKGTLVSVGDGGSMTPQGGVYNNWAAGEPDNNDLYGNAGIFSVADGKWYDESFYDNSYDFFYKLTVIEYGGSVGDSTLNTIFTKTLSAMFTLPVNWISFEVKKDHGQAVAEWVTGQEIYNSYFSVERSSDNRNFSAIGKVIANSNPGSRNNYRFTDAQPLKGVSYYRIRQVDQDSSHSYSLTRRIEFANDGSTSRLYPTTATNSVRVEIGDAAGVNCFVVDASGRIVRKLRPETAIFDLSIESLSSGVYILQIVKENGQQENLRFVKQ